MSGYPSLRPHSSSSKVIDLPNGLYGIPDAMLNGLQACRASSSLQTVHPLQASEMVWQDHQMKMDFVMLRNSQGLHAPLKLQMEHFAVSQMQRLPCLHSSNLMMDTLTGADDLIKFEDILNNPADSEVMGQPHAMMERKLGLL
ncbi:proteasome maturation protein [Biomphalaria glabrata]|nr:proteasome maturation protein-like [Biomphalaria glabrata]